MQCATVQLSQTVRNTFCVIFVRENSDIIVCQTKRENKQINKHFFCRIAAPVLMHRTEAQCGGPVRSFTLLHKAPVTFQEDLFHENHHLSHPIQ